MKILKSILVLVLFVGFAFSVNAQDSESKLNQEQEIKSQKIAFFTNKTGSSDTTNTVPNDGNTHVLGFELSKCFLGTCAK